MSTEVLPERMKIKGLAKDLVNSYLLTEAAKHDLVISLYGAEDRILDDVSNEMKEYLIEMRNKTIRVIKGTREDPYSVDVGFYFNGNGKIVG